MNDRTQRILTGDRPTGRLHLGHYVGSLKNRVALQADHEQFILIADIQALTDNADNTEKVSSSVLEVAFDNLASGVDPNRSTFVVQSMIPEIAELTVLFLNLVTLARLERNPTVKDEMRQKGFGTNVPAGFLMYPVSEAADILTFRATLVPAGNDQKPMIEQANEILHKFNTLYSPVFEHVEILESSAPRLPGTDGAAKMSKSLNNCIYLSDNDDTIREKVKSMYTDPKHIRTQDPGVVEGNVVFTYLDAFDPDASGVEGLKERYRAGGVGDVEVKDRLTELLIGIIGPIREKRDELSRDRPAVIKILKEGTEKGREIATETMRAVRSAMNINYF